MRAGRGRRWCFWPPRASASTTRSPASWRPRSGCCSSYYGIDPAPGDIVTFHDPDPEQGGRILIQRVIAVGGQTVDLRDGRAIPCCSSHLTDAAGKRVYPPWGKEELRGVGDR